MKIKSFLCAVCAVVALGACSYDDGEIWDAVNDQEMRISALEKWQATVETQLSSLQGILTATDYVTGVEEISDENGAGYKISFLHSDAITLYVNEDNAVSGATEGVIGVAQDDDSEWYWTLDGEPLQVDGETVYVSGGDDISLVPNTDGTYTLTIGDNEVTIPLMTLPHPISSVTEEDYIVTVTLNDDNSTVLELVRYADLANAMLADYNNDGGATQTITLNLPESYIIKMLDDVPSGWTFTVTNESIVVVYPSSGETTVTFLISDGQTQTVMKNVTFRVSSEAAWTEVSFDGTTAITITEDMRKVKVVPTSSSIAAISASGDFSTFILNPLRKNLLITDIDLSELNVTCTVPANGFATNEGSGYVGHALETFIFPKTITNMYGNIFNGCAYLKSVTFPGTSVVYNANQISTWFTGCDALEAIYVPSDLVERYKSTWSAKASDDIVNLIQAIIEE